MARCKRRASPTAETARGPLSSSAFPWFESYRRLRCCAPSPALAGEGWGGGKPHTRSPEAFAFAAASADEAADKSAVPEWRPHPTLPRKSGRGSERTTLVAGNDALHGLDTLINHVGVRVGRVRRLGKEPGLRRAHRHVEIQPLGRDRLLEPLVIQPGA